MAKKKKASGKTSVFWRIAISALGIALIIIAVANLLLFFFGTYTAASVTTRRYGGADDGKPSDMRYTWSIDYTFVDTKGDIHSGHTTKRGSDSSVKIDSYIYYFPSAPFISVMESEAEPGISQLIYMSLGILLLSVMNKKKNRGKKATKHDDVDNVQELTDYDEYTDDILDEDE